MGSTRISSVFCSKIIRSNTETGYCGQDGAADWVVWSWTQFSCNDRPKRGHNWRQSYKRTTTAQLQMPKQYKWEQVLWTGSKTEEITGRRKSSRDIVERLITLIKSAIVGCTCELGYRKSKHFWYKKILRFHYARDWSPNPCLCYMYELKSCLPWKFEQGHEFVHHQIGEDFECQLPCW